MKISQINYAVYVAKYQSFSIAAQKLFITQPTLSQQIRQLENELGTPLFVRNTREVKLTKAGMDFLEHAKLLLEEVDHLEFVMQKYRSPIKGTLRIGLIWTFAYLGVNELMYSFSDAYPDIKTTFSIDGSVQLMEALQSHKLDMIFINVPSEEFKEDYCYYNISESPLCIVVNSRHPLALKSTVTASDLCDESIFLPTENTSIGKDILLYIKEYLPKMHIVGRSSQVDVCVQIAASNLGISFISQNAVSSSVFQHLPIKTIPLQPTIERRTYLVYHKQKKLDPLLNTFVSYAIKYYQ